MNNLKNGKITVRLFCSACQQEIFTDDVTVELFGNVVHRSCYDNFMKEE